MRLEHVRRWLTTLSLAVLAGVALFTTIAVREARASRTGVECVQVQSVLESGVAGGNRQIELAASTLISQGEPNGIFGLQLERWTYLCAYGEAFGGYSAPAGTPRVIDSSELDDPESFLRGR